MKRKVVKHGPSSLIVSVPSDWAKRNSIVKGSEVDVREDGKRLIVSAENSIEAQHAEVDIDVTGLDRTSLMFALRSLYRLGYDTVNITFEKDTTTYYRTGEKLSVSSVIHTEVNRLIGFEVIKERENSCVIKDLETASMKDFDHVERRIFLLIMDASVQFYEGSKKYNAALLGALEEKHDTITKFVSYCLRLLNKNRQYFQMENTYHYHILALLDRVTDVIKYSAREVREHGKPLHKKVMEVLGAVNSHLRLYYELFYKYETEKVVEISISRYGIQEKIKKLPEQVKPTEKRIASNMANITDHVLDLIEASTGLEYATQSKIS